MINVVTSRNPKSIPLTWRNINCVNNYKCGNDVIYNADSDLLIITVMIIMIMKQ